MSSSFARRLFLQFLGIGSTATAVGCGSEEAASNSDDLSQGEFEYIIVGSGAGGGPLAANLARAGHRVLLIEAGNDHGSLLNYQVPAFHPQSTEDPAMRWDYFVKHYSDEEQARRDPKHTEEGVLYPRAGTLGGCTAHHAMVTVYPHELDWDHIAEATGDSSWQSTKMRRYFEILEKCEYLQGKGDGGRGHGFKGWLHTHLPDASLALGDPKILKVIVGAAVAFGAERLFGGSFGRPGDSLFQSQLLKLLKRDLNSADAKRDTTEGLFMVPLATDGRSRKGPREYILSTVAAGYPLTVRTNALATKVLFDEQDVDGKKRAIGIEYLEGKHLYRADPNAERSDAGTKKTVRASREVILAAGVFNTPQLLKLSGIGPAAELESFDIPVLVDLPGVGTNLQDRYEVGLLHELGSDLKSVEDCTFGVGDDPCLEEWRSGKGVYRNNGVVVSVLKRSAESESVPDLIIVGSPGKFRGYDPGHSARLFEDKHHFTWTVLKGHTKNTAGTVALRSADPRDVPEINFRYFHEGTTERGEDHSDLRAVVEGVKFVRHMSSTIDKLMVFGKFKEVWPGPATETDLDVETFVKDEAWGHHASCTCKIGADDDPMAVLDSRFRVRGTAGLRVVDASVFPKIPGFFIVVPIYMISEKATDVLLEDIGETRPV